MTSKEQLLRYRGNTSSKRAMGAGVFAFAARALVGRLTICLSAFLAVSLVSVSMASAAPPVVTIDPTVTAGYTEAHVTGTVEPHGEEMNIYVEYATSAGGPFSYQFVRVIPAGTSGPTSISAQVEQLAANTQYFFRLDAENSANGEIYSPTPYPSATTKAVVAPDVAIDAPTAVTGETAHLSGQINPNAPEPEGSTDTDERAAFEVGWHFACTPECPGLAGSVAAGNAARSIEAEATGLAPGRTYRVELVAQNAGGAATRVVAGPEVFTTAPGAPSVGKLAASDATESGATLRAEIDPAGAPTTFHFEYLTEAQYENEGGFSSPHAVHTPETAMAGLNGGSETVSAPVTGLSAGTVYDFRVVATNTSSGNPVVVSAGKSFRTESPPVEHPAGECPNETVRSENRSSGLPDCRVYEQVTPSNKNAAAWTIGANSTELENGGGASLWAVSELGNRLVLFSTTPFGAPDPGSWDTFQPQLVQRTSGGWQSTPLPPAINPSVDPFNFEGVLAEPLFGYTPDFSTLAFRSEYRLSSRDQDEQAVGRDVYIYHPERPEAGFELATCPPAPGGSGTPPDCSENASLEARAPGAAPRMSTDGSTLIFEDAETFLAGNGQPLFPDASGEQIYANHDGTIQWVSQPLSTVPEGATQVSGPVSFYETVGRSNAVSENGSRVFFSAGGFFSGRIYVRINNESTLEVSRSRGGSGTAEEVRFFGASADGNRALIGTTQQLLPSAPGGPASDPNTVKDFYLWNYDPQSDPSNEGPEALTRLTGLTQVGFGPSPDGEEVSNVLGFNPAMTRVYFTVGSNLYLAELPAGEPSAGTLRWVAAIGTSSCLNEALGGGSVYGICARTSPDGRYLAFESSEQLTSGDNDSSTDVYLYDAQTHVLERASVGESGGNGPLDATLFGDSIGFANTRQVTNSGELFFVTDEELTSGDVNQKQDVYAYSPSAGSASLISGGHGPFNSIFAGSGNEGRDIYFFTGDGLVPGDTGEDIDVYDARVDGGFPSSAETPCEVLNGECQGGAPPAPASSGSATAAFSGPGNQVKKATKAKPHKKKKHKKKKHKKKSHKKKSHGKKKHGKHHANRKAR
jgi:hypothetical protein